MSDLATGKAFYAGALGYAVAGEHARPERGDTVAYLRLGGMPLRPVADAGHLPRASHPEALGLRHLAFQACEIDAAVQSISTKGFAAAPIYTDMLTGGRMTFVFDPDGQPPEKHAWRRSAAIRTHCGRRQVNKAGASQPPNAARRILSGYGWKSKKQRKHGHRH